MNNGIWRYIAIATLGICGGLLTGQYTPNRSLVTKDDLQPLVAHQQQMDSRLRVVEDTLSEIKGKMEEQEARRGAYDRSR